LHLVKENRVISKDCRSQDKFMHDIHVALSKHYIENLREEVKKGMREKAEQGIYPGRAPLGYRNNSALGNIEVSAENAKGLNQGDNGSSLGEDWRRSQAFYFKAQCKTQTKKYSYKCCIIGRSIKK
jgi:hypothetical protein